MVPLKFEIYPRPTFIPTVTKVWNSTSNNEIIVRFMSKRLDRHRVRQNIAYLVVHWCLAVWIPVYINFVYRVCIHQRIQFKDCLHHIQDHPHHSACLSELCSWTLHSSSYTLRSSDTNLLSVPRVRTCFGSRSFSVAAPLFGILSLLTLAIAVL